MAQAAVILATSAYSAYATNQASKDQQKIANSNAALTDAAAGDAINRGNEEMLAVRRRTRGLVGKQRAAFAAQGIDVSSGTAMDLQDETQQAGTMDEATVRKNAFREAWGLTKQASNERIGGAYARRAGQSQALGQLGQGVVSAAPELIARAAPFFNGKRPKISGQG